MSPTSREREYARRRYEKWQTKQAARYQRRRQQRRYAALAAAAAVTIVVIAVVVVMTLHRGGSDTAASPSTSVSSAAGNNPCPKPAATAPANVKSWSKPPAASLAQGKSWTWTVETSCGPLLATLDGAKAPQAVASTIFLTQQGFYGSSPCHRLTTKGIYVLQCGDPTGKGNGGPGYSYGPVENAPKNNVYPAGTIAMARQSGNGTSMGSQFFLVYKDSTIPSDVAGGYTVVGKITGGLGTLEKVSAGGVEGGTGDGAPVRALSIVSATVAAS